MLLIIGFSMNQKRVYKNYPKEFKEEAVALIIDQGYTVAKPIAPTLFCPGNHFSTTNCIRPIPRFFTHLAPVSIEAQ